MINFTKYFKKGDIIYGFCNGYFGRDDYETKIVEEVTEDYVVFRYEDMTFLKDCNDESFQIQEYTLLQSSRVANYSGIKEQTTIDVDEISKMFIQWKKEEDY